MTDTEPASPPTSERDPLTPPLPLEGAAFALWQGFIGDAADNDLEPDSRELALLYRACSALTHVERLQREVAALPSLVTTGSAGQVVSHPLLATLAAAEATALASLRALAVSPDASAAASAKASKRWHGPAVVNLR
ncbi:hypothetical protein ACUN7V_02425 [Quadrisphaera oryzae]|uniref:hypothetical protein n=1 Tax=Quadrisphaera TaxID=317661 RepID=UPI00164963DB|nr:hypothetical protein [Quadrisphaera sp. RL12-1S]MBC3761076.1 hypothetical protein [Quadrisphaera sp. RL12-1S]